MFIFKKIFSLFLFPLPLSLGLSFVGLVLLWFTKKKKMGKVLVSTGFLIILLLSYSLVANELLRPLEGRYAPHSVQLSNEGLVSEAGHPVKFVVVLGGGHISDPKLPITSQINGISLVRLVEGIRIYRRHSGSKLVLSGGILYDPIPEAKVMANLAKEIGVDDNDIIIESKSRDTKDQAIYIKSIVGNDRFILVTSASHMPRSMAILRKLGMNPIPAPTGHRVRSNQGLNPGLFFPDADNLRNAEATFYEYLGIAWAKLRGQI